ncbi:MAG: hypothetical protein B6D41_01190 [Chloroflexi bacterium UTCFX4]|jgi:hypothetical protein|nr:MAG: hypothetical protein B6D41_01190 [Chloroflexi bacterium UTCFX4]
MLEMNLTQTIPSANSDAFGTHQDDAQLERAVNSLMMVMALENSGMFDDVALMTPEFDELETELAVLQMNELRAAYERVAQTEIALDAVLAVANANAETELQIARGAAEEIAREINRLRDETTALENVFEPQYQQLAQAMDAERQRAAELRNKATGLNPEARSQFESKVELVLQARLQPFEQQYAALEAERSARRQPLEEQISALESQRLEREQEMERVTNGQSETQQRVLAMCEGQAEEGAALYNAVRELLAAREHFGAHVERVEKNLDARFRIKEITKRHTDFVERARLELDAPINAAGALARAKDGEIHDAERLLELALRGGLDESKANEIRQEIARAEYAVLVKTWEQDLIRRASQLNGMNAVNRYKENIAAKSRELGYASLSRDLARAVAHAEKIAGQGVAARRRALEAHAAQYINSQNKFFSAQVMPDSGRVMIAVKKNGVWLRHALCQTVEADGGYEIKTNYYEHKTALDDQAEWDTRRARLEKRLQNLLVRQGEETVQ